MEAIFYDLIEAIKNSLGVSESDILSKNRKVDICEARIILSFELRKEGMTLEEIGMILQRHHASVISGLKSYSNKLKFDVIFRDKVKEFKKWKDIIFERNMKKSITLDNNKLLVLNNSMLILDSFNLQDLPKNSRSLISICKEIRTDLLKKAIDKREKDKGFVLKFSYYKAEAIHDYLKGYEIYFPDNFGSYEANVILQIKNELHRQLL